MVLKEQVVSFKREQNHDKERKVLSPYTGTIQIQKNCFADHWV